MGTSSFERINSDWRGDLMFKYFREKEYGRSQFQWDIQNLKRWTLVRLFWIRHPIMRLNAHKYIPHGIYCYGRLGEAMHNAKGELIGFETDRCLFQSFDGMQLCLYDGGDCYNDSCKTCGVNDDWEEEDEQSYN